MILVADGLVFQRGKPLSLPASINEEDAKHLHVADVSLLLAEDQDNYYQVIALPIPGTQFADANKAIVVDIPERKVELTVSDAKASDCKAWIKKTVELDRRRAEEDAAKADEEEDEREEEEEADDQPPPMLETPVLAPLVAQPAPAQLPAPVAAQPIIAQLAPEPMGQLEVLAPIPLQFDDGKQGG